MIYSFEVEVSGIDLSDDFFVDRLFNAGCNDALLCVQNNILYIDFNREANSYDEAVDSAKKNIESIGGCVENVRVIM
jgi:hypothetical protein